MKHYTIKHSEETNKIADLEISIEDMIKHPHEIATLLETLPFLNEEESDLLYFLQQKIEEFEYYYSIMATDCLENKYSTCYEGKNIEINVNFTHTTEKTHGWTVLKAWHIDFYKTENTLILE